MEFPKALTEMIRQLREGNGKSGLVLANGGVVTYQYVVCLSSLPRNPSYPNANPLPESVTDWFVPPIVAAAEGPAIIETYTVEFSRDGKPETGFVVGRLKNGHRFLANHKDEKTLSELSSKVREPIGRKGYVTIGDDGRSLFSFQDSGKL